MEKREVNIASRISTPFVVGQSCPHCGTCRIGSGTVPIRDWIDETMFNSNSPMRVWLESACVMVQSWPALPAYGLFI